MLQKTSKKMMKQLMPALILGLFSLAVLPSIVLADQQNISITGGSVAGIYFQAAKNMCMLLNRAKPKDYSCKGRSGLGSTFNVNALGKKVINFGLVQSDIGWQAWNGKGDWDGKPVASLRSLFSLHSEAIHLVVRADLGVKDIQGIRGKRINVGNLSSGQRESAMTILKLYGLNPRDDIDGFSYQQGNALLNYESGYLDGFFYTVGVPSQPIADVAKTVPSIVVPLDDDRIQALQKASPYYVLDTIKGGTYPGNSGDVTTLSVKATLLTNDKASDDVVYDLVSVFFSKLDQFRKIHPVFANLKPEDMLKGLTAPIHPGALKYYREQGWIKP